MGHKKGTPVSNTVPIVSNKGTIVCKKACARFAPIYGGAYEEEKTIRLLQLYEIKLGGILH